MPGSLTLGDLEKSLSLQVRANSEVDAEEPTAFGAFCRFGTERYGTSCSFAHAFQASQLF